MYVEAGVELGPDSRLDADSAGDQAPSDVTQPDAAPTDGPVGDLPPPKHCTTSDNFTNGSSKEMDFDVVLDAQDVPHLLYTDASKVLTHRWYDGSWNSETIAASIKAYRLAAAIDGNRLHVAFQRTVSSPGLYHTYRDLKAGSKWLTAPALVSASSGIGTSVSMAAGGSQVYLASGTGTSVHLYRLVFGGGKYTFKPVINQTERSRVSTAAGAKGLFLTSSTTSANSWVATTMPHSGGASLSTSTISGGGASSSSLELAVDSKGAAHMVYVPDTQHGRGPLMYFTWDGKSPGSFAKSVQISATNNIHVGSLGIAINNSDVVTVTYYDVPPYSATPVNGVLYAATRSTKSWIKTAIVSFGSITSNVLGGRTRVAMGSNKMHIVSHYDWSSAVWHDCFSLP